LLYVFFFSLILPKRQYRQYHRNTKDSTQKNSREYLIFALFYEFQFVLVCLQWDGYELECLKPEEHICYVETREKESRLEMRQCVRYFCDFGLFELDDFGWVDWKWRRWVFHQRIYDMNTSTYQQVKQGFV